MNGKIYFAAVPGRIKIGISTNVEARLEEIGTHLLEPLTLLGVMDGDDAFEAAFHKRLHKYCLKGEWFADCEEVRAVIASRNPFDDAAPSSALNGSRVSLLLDRAKKRWPYKPAEEIARCTGAPIRTAYAWVGGQNSMSGEAALCLLDVLDTLDGLDKLTGEAA